MYPELFSIGPFTIHTYGAMLAVGALLGIWVVNSKAKADPDLDQERVVNLTFWVLITGLLGTRLFFVFLEPEGFLEQPWRFFFLWDGGLVFYGGVIVGFPVAFFLARRWGQPMLPLLDALAPGVALAQAFGRIGCFMAGCCYGRPWDGWCSVVFTDPQGHAPRNIPLHPAQLYSSIELFLLFGFLMWLSKRRKYGGQVFFAYGLIHGTARLIIEQFRGDWRGETIVNGLTTTGLFALCLALFSLGALIYLNRKHKS